MDKTRIAPAEEPRVAPAWEIRIATAERMRAYTAPLATAFAEEVTEAEYEDWFRVAEPERWIAAFDGPPGRDALGCAGAITFRLTVPGGEVAAAGVTGVGVRPDHHRRGILRALMRHQLDDLRARGEPVAVLWASEGAIYQRFGYGLATMSGFLEIERSRSAFARHYPTAGSLRLVDEEQALAAFPPVYEAMRQVTPGALSRSDVWWRSGAVADREYSRRGAGPKFRYLYEVDGKAEGYAMFRVKSEWDHRGSNSQLQVQEAIALTPRAVREVWRFLFDVDLVRTVRAGRVPVPNPLHHLLAEPRALGLVAGDGIWLRVVDLPGALAARRYATADAITLEVTDAFCPWNAGRWRLVTSGVPGAAAGTATRTEDSPDLVLDTTDLAAAYLGGVRLVDLAAVGRVEERTPGALRRADALFSADRAPWCVTMF
jgi:predicted acetyltransferase